MNADQQQRASVMSDKLWDIANVIAGFAVLQAVGVIYFALEKDQTIHKWTSLVPFAVLLVFFGAGVYAMAVWACFRAEFGLREECGETARCLCICRKVFLGRVVTIMTFNFMAICVTLLARVKFG